MKEKKKEGKLNVNPRRALLLDREGIILALVLGVLLTWFGGLRALTLMIAFLFIAVAVTKYGYEEKKEFGLYEHERSWENVVSNGLVPLIGLVVSPLLYVTTVAAMEADKFASELGVLGGEPRSIITFKKVKRGTSGGMTVFGTWMSMVGGLTIALLGKMLYGYDWWTTLWITIIAFMGSLADTLFGVLEERGIGNKMTTNIICGLVALILGYLVFLR